MAESVIGFAENQLKRLGMLMAMTPDLKDKLTNNAGAFEHSFEKEFDKDRLSVNLHFRKSTQSGLSFINKFEASLKKEGQPDELKQTFFVPKETKFVHSENGDIRYDNKYTLKEAYNLLSGRPVFKNLLSKEEVGYDAWVKLNNKKTLENGNHELKLYNRNYGFSLEGVLKEYSIKELANPQYKANLIESLHRGNLQKAAFVGKDGNERQLFISPSITTGSLNVFDDAKKRVPLERLLNDSLISKDLVGRLKERFAETEKPTVNSATVQVEKEALKKAEKIGTANVQKESQRPSSGKRLKKKANIE